jgi:DNA-binding MarR family transcriptional regulator/GNAT superfamily N-acetyltransferase
MDPDEKTFVRNVRKFNRFYTGILGLIDRDILSSDFSLSQARVLYEIGSGGNYTAKLLTERLDIDAGYLSRMVKRFEKDGLIRRMQSQDDGRIYFLYLTEYGKVILTKLIDSSEEQILKLTKGLSKPDKLRISREMSDLEMVLSGKKEQSISVRHDLKPGDAGSLIALHGWIYAQECGYNHIFEAYVCKTFYDFLKSYDSGRDRIWFAEDDGEMIGAIAAVGRKNSTVQLRWFLLHPDYRGLGLGGKLLSDAIQHCSDKGFSSIFLETTDDQETAIRMYVKAGFRKTKEYKDDSWGKEHMEQTYELSLQGSNQFL